jgi:hypothetical protein
MGATLPAIDDDLRAWLAAQHVFFVGTAPAGDEGHVNVSPKGYDSFRVLGEREVAYLDLTGSGVETIAHLRENGRICLMFCAFAGNPRIVRLHGRGEAVLLGDPRFDALVSGFPDLPGTRAVIRVDVDRISDSCGFSVPLLAFEGERDRLRTWADKKGPDGVAGYRARKNRRSIDGLPGIPGPD